MDTFVASVKHGCGHMLATEVVRDFFESRDDAIERARLDFCPRCEAKFSNWENGCKPMYGPNKKACELAEQIRLRAYHEFGRNSAFLKSQCQLIGDAEIASLCDWSIEWIREMVYEKTLASEFIKHESLLVNPTLKNLVRFALECKADYLCKKINKFDKQKAKKPLF